MASQTNYELYSYTRGRWTLHAQYPASGKNKALSAAESLFQNAATDAVSVIEERFDAARDSSSEYTVFSDAKNDSVPNLRGHQIKPASAQKSRHFEYTAPAAPAAPREKPAKRKTATRTAGVEPAAPNPILFTGTVIGVIVVGVAIAWGVATGMAMIGYGAALLGGSAGGANPNTWTIVFLVALVAFLVFGFGKTVSRGEISALLGTSSGRPALNPRPPSIAIDTDAEAGVPIAMSEPGEPVVLPVESPASDPQVAASASVEPDAAPIIDAAGPAIEGAGAATTAVERAPGEEAKDDGGDENPIEGARLTIIGFLGSCLSYLEREDLHLTSGRLDGYNAFGCNLFLAGACEAIAKSRSLSADGFREVLDNCLEVLNQNLDRAGRFGERYEEYLLEPTYCDMFEAGRAALDAFVDDDETGDVGAETDVIDDAQAVFRFGVPTLGGGGEVLARLVEILVYADTVAMHQPKIVRGLGIACRGR